MRIGDFAKKYDMNVTAIRYYIDNALLTPQKQNNQYIFDKSCVEDMDKILEYKKCGLSLEEIELLFFLEKTSRFQDETILQIVQDLFEEKIADYKDEQIRIQESISLLEEHLKRFSSITVQQQESVKAGIPFSFIPYLYCPHCNAPLSMENTKIQNGHLYEGDLMCACGYHATIAGGIGEIPLRKDSIDIYMDDYSVSNSLFTYGHFIYNKLSE